MKVSIITVCLNCHEAIESTVLSVINQSYSNIEYIVIDGNSSDGTLEVLAGYLDKIDYVTSESDNGIYQAMNKGLEVCSGDYILFLNCGDRLYSETVIEKLAAQSNSQDILYGDLMLDFTDGRKNKIHRQPVKLNRFLFIHRTLMHQSTLVNRRIFRIYGNFEEKYPISADLEFFLRVLFRPGVSKVHMPIIISSYDMHGISASPESFKIRQRDRLRILKKHLPFPLYLIARLRYSLVMKRRKKVYKRILNSIDKILHFLGGL